MMDIHRSKFNVLNGKPFLHLFNTVNINSERMHYYSKVEGADAH